MDVLDSGVSLCKLAKHIQSKAEESKKEGNLTEVNSILMCQAIFCLE